MFVRTLPVREAVPEIVMRERARCLRGGLAYRKQHRAPAADPPARHCHRHCRCHRHRRRPPASGPRQVIARV
jgi:hypothetical protein